MPNNDEFLDRQSATGQASPQSSATKRASVSPEGILSIPTGLPLPCGYKVVVTAMPQRCLKVFRVENWLDIRDQFLSNAYSISPFADIRRLMLGFSVDLEVVEHSLSLPFALRKFALIKDAAVWVPVTTGYELWNPDIFDLKIYFGSDEQVTD